MTVWELIEITREYQTRLRMCLANVINGMSDMWLQYAMISVWRVVNGSECEVGELFGQTVWENSDPNRLNILICQFSPQFSTKMWGVIYVQDHTTTLPRPWSIMPETGIAIDCNSLVWDMIFEPRLWHSSHSDISRPKDHAQLIRRWLQGAGVDDGKPWELPPRERDGMLIRQSTCPLTELPGDSSVVGDKGAYRLGAASCLVFPSRVRWMLPVEKRQMPSLKWDFRTVRHMVPAPCAIDGVLQLCNWEREACQSGRVTSGGA